MLNKKTKKELENSFNATIQENILKQREREHERKKAGIILYYYSTNYESVIFSPFTGYKLQELPNNKPLTLLNEKKKHINDFVSFANIKSFNDGSDWFTLFDINEDKKTISNNGSLPNLGCAWKDARKDEGRIFIILNKNISLYRENFVKHYKRQEEKKTLTGCERWTLSPQSIETFDRTHYRLFNKWHRLTGEEIDKSGYYLPLFREKLKERAEQVRKEKQRIKEEKRRANFIASDKSHHKNAIDILIKAHKSAIIKMLSYDKIMTYGVISLLDTLKSNILELEKISKTLNDYARYNDPEKEIENDIYKIHEKYLIAITKYNNSSLNWCSVGCYRVVSGEVVARYEWVGKENTCHAGEVVRCPVNLSNF